MKLVLELQVDSDELVRRMLARKRPDDTPDTIAQRLEVYKNQTAPVLQYYAEQGLLADDRRVRELRTTCSSGFAEPSSAKHQVDAAAWAIRGPKLIGATERVELAA